MTADATGGREPSRSVVCLSGSSRFVGQGAVLAWEMEKRGHVAMGMNLLPDWYPDVQEDHQAESEDVAPILDRVHLRKIELADCLVVMDFNGYIGRSTSVEIAYASGLGKPVHYVGGSGEVGELRAFAAAYRAPGDREAREPVGHVVVYDNGKGDRDLWLNEFVNVLDHESAKACADEMNTKGNGYTYTAYALEPVGGAAPTPEEPMEEIREAYQRLPEAHWFRQVYDGKSMGEVTPVDDGTPAPEEDGLRPAADLAARCVELRGENARLRVEIDRLRATPSRLPNVPDTVGEVDVLPRGATLEMS